MQSEDKVAVVGAGIGGLAAAVRLAQAGLRVTVLERHAHPGGKIRTLPSGAGPVDAGPTVLTMRHVFDDLFAAAGERTEDHVVLERIPLLARHFWADGSTLDLWDDPERSAQAVRAFGGPQAEADFRAFSARARRLYEGFQAPVMNAPAPSFARLAGHVLRHPRLLLDMGTGSLAGALSRGFRDPRLAQLFGRYATYVGGSPYRSPAVLGLIWHAEAQGVWRVKGGMHRLAEALAALARARGAEIRTETGAARIEVQGGRPVCVWTETGERIAVDHVVYNGDPKALAEGRLGAAAQRAVPRQGVRPRSLSALVGAFAAAVEGPELAYHNVFFAADPRAEFGPLEAGRLPEDPTVYICAEDRGEGPPAPGTLERFETIVNAPPLGATPHTEEDIAACLTRAQATLARSGLTFHPAPGPDRTTTPEGFAQLFPGSDGSLYGRSPHGLMAAFSRPTARTSQPGLALCGGGVHPGAGIPMATLSGRHAAETILNGRTSISTSRRTATPGGMSTGSPTTGSARSPSSGSSAPSSRRGIAGPAGKTPPTTAA